MPKMFKGNAISEVTDVNVALYLKNGWKIVGEVIEEVEEEVKNTENLDYSTLTVLQLREVAKEKGVSIRGTKADIIERIKASDIKTDDKKVNNEGFNDSLILEG